MIIPNHKSFPNENKQKTKFISLISKYSRTHTITTSVFERDIPLDLWRSLKGCKKDIWRYPRGTISTIFGIHMALPVLSSLFLYRLCWLKAPVTPSYDGWSSCIIRLKEKDFWKIILEKKLTKKTGICSRFSRMNILSFIWQFVMKDNGVFASSVVHVEALFKICLWEVTLKPPNPAEGHL
jgi:hypothetical protein